MFTHLPDVQPPSRILISLTKRWNGRSRRDRGGGLARGGIALLLAHGLRAVEALRARFPDHPIVADLKTMDGGYLEAEMMARPARISWSSWAGRTKRRSGASSTPDVTSGSR
jgi:hypothetical protein